MEFIIIRILQVWKIDKYKDDDLTIKLSPRSKLTLDGDYYTQEFRVSVPVKEQLDSPYNNDSWKLENGDKYSIGEHSIYAKGNLSLNQNIAGSKIAINPVEYGDSDGDSDKKWTNSGFSAAETLENNKIAVKQGDYVKLMIPKDKITTLTEPLAFNLNGGSTTYDYKVTQEKHEFNDDYFSKYIESLPDDSADDAKAIAIEEFDNLKKINETNGGFNFLEVTGKHTSEEQDSASYHNVKVHYVDENGKTIENGKYDQSIFGANQSTPDDQDYLNYDVSGKEYQPTINGYTLDKSKLPDNSKGQFKDNQNEINVTYVYKDNSVKPVADGKVTVKYVDENGKEIATQVVLNGKVGADYQTEQKTIAGYQFKKVTGKIKGTFTEDDQTVIYVYQKITSDQPDSNTDQPDDSQTPGDKPATGQSTSSDNSTKAKVIASNKQKKANENKLPQTGEKQQTRLVLLGLIILGLFGVIIMTPLKKLTK